MRSILITSFLFLSLGLFAQQTSKVPLSLVMQTAGFPAEQMISIHVEGDPAQVAAAAKSHGGFLMYNAGTMCSVQIPCGQLQSFANEPAVLRVGNAPINQQTLNDTMKKQTGVNDVRAGLAPLSQGYTGAGIVMGIIDSGIDYHHPDFQDANGNTRIYRIWDQRDQTGPGPQPWGYGTEWDSTSLNNNTCTHNDLTYYGHGTHVSGIAGGNGLSDTIMDMSGVAPDVLYVVVALDFNGAFSTTAVADAAAYIYSVAQSLTMPCVINASVGDYYGSHDGQDLQSLMIDTLLDTPGRLFVSAAGNAGGYSIHMEHTLNTDTAFTWYNVSNGSIYVQLWADTNNFNAADFAIGVTRTSDYADLDRAPFTDMAGNLLMYSYDTLRNSSGQQIARVMRYGSVQGSAYSMEFLITPDSLSGYNYGLYTTGAGHFDCWSFDYYGGNLPSVGTYPAIADYVAPDQTQNIVGGFQCSDRVICVANYVNRDEWPNYLNTVTYDTTVTAGELMYNSSVGPTRDGRIKPEIAAPGANDISCIETNSQAAIIAGAPTAVTPAGWHVVGGGTSAASPVVAGIGALWLERFPTATWQEYRAAVWYCAKQDTFTGTNLPNSDWGYGKVDAWMMMTNCATSLSVTAPAPQNGMAVFPNPSAEGTGVTIQLAADQNNVPVNIYNAIGELVFVGYTDNTGKLVVSNLTAGMYVATVQSENGGSARFMVQ